MKLIKIDAKYSVQFAASTRNEIESLFMVCSHERSGTHFLINSISGCTKYENTPLYLFDYRPFLGADHMFFSPEANEKLLQDLSFFKINNNDNDMCMASIIKSHFPISILGNVLPSNLKIAYIYRNPVDVFISYWRFLHKAKWSEGPKTSTPLELAIHVPSGNSQRYQTRNFQNYFERWAEHVSTANQYLKKSNKIALVSYKQLLYNYDRTINELCHKLNIKIISKPNLIEREDKKLSIYLKGSNIELRSNYREELYDYCSKNIKNYPHLPQKIMDA